MTETIIVALIGFAGTLAGAFLGVLTSAKLTTYRIEQLEKKWTSIIISHPGSRRWRSRSRWPTTGLRTWSTLCRRRKQYEN